jgi:signal transduction histidine kinase
LFVDDDEGNLIVCEAHCSSRFEVLTARCAKEALEVIEREEVGVVVADQRMPGATGVELLEQIRDSNPDNVRILITAYSDLSAAIGAINRGQVRRYLRKPWRPEELIAELSDAMDVYDMSRKLRALGARLRETERVYALGIIAAGVGHELRNPVSWVHGNLELLKGQLGTLADDRVLPAELRDRVVKMSRSLDDASEGVNRIFDIVRGIGNPLKAAPISAEQVDLEEIVRLTLRLVSGELRDTARVECDFRKCPHVLASTTRIGQIVLNLVVNAIQALSESGLTADKNLIRIRLYASDGEACLNVADNGRGIDEENRERVFDPFFTTKAGDGTGLGLAICRQIALELGGSLDVAADPELGGALFRLKLPC